MENIQKQTFWGKLMKKNKASTYDIAEKTNIPEEKVKEIVNGERTLPTDKVNDFVTAIHETKKESKKSKRNEALLFFADKDFKELRLRFNYKRQKDLSNVVGVSQFSVSKAESVGVSTLSTAILLKFYNFFKDELNIKVNSVKETKESYKIVKSKDDIKNNKADLKKYKKYLKENNLKTLIEERGMSIPQFSKLAGINNTTVYKYLNKKIDWSLDMYKKVFKFLNINLDEPNKEEINIENNILEAVPVNLEKNIFEEKSKNTNDNAFISREIKNTELYNKIDNATNEPQYYAENLFYYTLYPNFDSEYLFNFLINNCITKDVMDLYKLLDSYFKN